MENRNIFKHTNGLAAAIIPHKPVLGLNQCRFILTNKLRLDKKGRLLLTYSERNEVKEYNNTTTEQRSKLFTQGCHSIITDVNIRYKNEIFQHDNFSSPLQMKLKGPDVWNLPHKTWSNVNLQQSVLKSGYSYILNRNRKLKATYSRRLNNSLNKTLIYVVIRDEYLE